MVKGEVEEVRAESLGMKPILLRRSLFIRGSSFVRGSVGRGMVGRVTVVGGSRGGRKVQKSEASSFWFVTMHLF